MGGTSFSVGLVPDAANRLQALTIHRNAAIIGGATFTYFDDGQLRTQQDQAGQQLQNVVTSAFAYDNADQLQSISYGDLQPSQPDQVFGTMRQANGNGLSEWATEQRGNQTIQHYYQYTDANQVEGDAYGTWDGEQLLNGEQDTWIPNLAGDIGISSVLPITAHEPGLRTSRTWHYGGAGELRSVETQGPGGTATDGYDYDLKGNRIGFRPGDGPTTTIYYGYNQANELTSYRDVHWNAGYTYTGEGLRSNKTISSACASCSDVSTDYTWDVGASLPLLLQEVKTTETAHGRSASYATHYVYGPLGILAEVLPDGTLYFEHADQHGDIRLLTDTQGHIAASYDYATYGQRTVTSGGAVPNPFGYTGQYLDAESQLLYLRARYYDPATQQFLTRDPVEAATGSPYAYAGGDPANADDPSGACPFCIAFAIGVAVNVAVGVGFDFLFDNSHFDLGGSVGNSLQDPLTYLFAIPFGEIGEALRVGERAGEGLRAVSRALDESDNFVHLAGAACSFTGDTEVTTDQGLQPIGDLRVGTLVLAYNQDTDTTAYYPVEAVLVHDDPIRVTLTVDGISIETTPEHPFYTQDCTWVPAGNLHVGDHVRKADGSFGVVQAVVVVRQPQEMYNLTVATAHTFFVGLQQLLVHNTCVYRSVNLLNGSVQYVGITEDFARRAAEHLRSRNMQIQLLIQGLTRDQARGVEQALIERHGLGASGGTLLNKINSIARTNPSYWQLQRVGKLILQIKGYK